MTDDLPRFQAVQARPITEPALVERMRKEATTWINAVHMQFHRVESPLINPDDLGAEVWRQEIDLHFFVAAIMRLRRAVVCASAVNQLRSSLADLLDVFDRTVPSARLLRNVSEHFDDYAVGRGNDKKIKRSQLQVWSLGQEDGQLIWRWLGEEVRLSAWHRAATTLYRGFLSDAGRYLADRPID